MPINRIAHSSTEIDIENYISILRTGQPISDTGWRTYVNTAGVNPVTGIGGTAGITWSQNNIDVLNGESDLRLVKDNSNRQGQGVSIDFTIDNRHLAKVLQITFDTELISGNYESPVITPTSGTYIIATGNCTVTANHSFAIGQVVTMTFTGATPPPNGTYVITNTTATTFVFAVTSGTAGSQTPCSYTVPADLRVSIIQDPNGTPVVIEPVNTGISLGISNPRQRIRHIATFQTHISLRTYRLCIHVANASTVAYTVDFANFRVWETTQSVGAVITDWISYTPSTTRANTTNRSFYYRRVGGSIQISFGWQYTAGVIGSSTALLTDIFPPGLTLDLTRIAPANGSGAYLRYNIGYYFVNDLGVNNYTGTITWDTNQDPDQIAFMGVAPNGADDNISGFIQCPIVGWGSSVAMSSDTGDGRVVAAKYRNQPSQTSSATVPLQFTTLEYDTHNAVTVGTVNTSNAWRYTAPVSGYYRVTVSSYCNTTATSYNLYRNGTSVGRISDFANNVVTNGSNTILLNSGDFIDVRSSQSFPAYSDAYISIERISAGSQVIATQETVAFRVTRTSNSAQGTGLIDIICDSSTNSSRNEFDTHGSYNTTTGVFTAPMSGVYQFNCYAHLNGTFTTGNIDLVIVTDTSNNIIQGITGIAAPGNFSYNSNGGFTMRMVSGQQIKFRVNRGNNVYVGGLTNQSSSAGFTTISGSRIGI